MNESVNSIVKRIESTAASEVAFDTSLLLLPSPGQNYP